MTVEEMFAVWWLMFGQYFSAKLDFIPRDREMARYAFEAGVEAGTRPGGLTEEEEGD